MGLSVQMFYILNCHIYRGKQIQEVYVIILTFSLKSKKNIPHSWRHFHTRIACLYMLFH